MNTSEPTFSNAPADRKDEDLKSRRPILVAVGAGLLLLVVIIVGVVLSSTTGNDDISSILIPSPPNRQPSFVGALKRSPALAMSIAIKYHLPKVIISAVVLVAIIAALVGTVLYAQYQQELRQRKEEALAVRQIEDPSEDLLVRPQEFFSLPVNSLALIGGCVLVIGAIVGIVLLARGGEKKGEDAKHDKEQNILALSKDELIAKVKSAYQAFVGSIDNNELIPDLFNGEDLKELEVCGETYTCKFFINEGFNARQYNIAFSYDSPLLLITETPPPPDQEVYMNTSFKALLITDKNLNLISKEQLAEALQFIQKLTDTVPKLRW